MVNCTLLGTFVNLRGSLENCIWPETIPRSPRSTSDYPSFRDGNPNVAQLVRWWRIQEGIIVYAGRLTSVTAEKRQQRHTSRDNFSKHEWFPSIVRRPDSSNGGHGSLRFLYDIPCTTMSVNTDHALCGSIEGVILPVHRELLLSCRVRES